MHAKIHPYSVLCFPFGLPLREFRSFNPCGSGLRQHKCQARSSSNFFSFADYSQIFKQTLEPSSMIPTRIRCNIRLIYIGSSGPSMRSVTLHDVRIRPLSPCLRPVPFDRNDDNSGAAKPSLCRGRHLHRARIAEHRWLADPQDCLSHAPYSAPSFFRFRRHSRIDMQIIVQSQRVHIRTKPDRSPTVFALS